MPLLNDGTILPEQMHMPINQMPDSVAAAALANSWRCSNGHILGVVIREKYHHDRTRPRLMLFRGALQPTDQANSAIPFAKMEAGEVVCGLCGEVKRWRPGDDFIEGLRKP